MKNIKWTILAFIIVGSLTAQPLKISSNGKYLFDSNDKPFIWLGDTAWELFHSLNREEATQYFMNRAEKGFNVIQCVLLPELQAETRPNAYGDFPLKTWDNLSLLITPGDNFDNPEEYDYWDHAEWIIKEGISKGLIMGVLPCWGEYVTPRFRERTIKTPREGYAYGWFLGNRFKAYNDQMIWILGGDRLPEEAYKGIETWQAMAEGITDGVNGVKKFDNSANFKATFMTYHCFKSSSTWFHEDEWIDIHTWGSYHMNRNNERAYDAPGCDLALPNPKPTLNSEPCYELLPIGYDWDKAAKGYFDDFDCRQAAYWSVFAGACGHTYGCHPIWQMRKKENPNPPLTLTTPKEWHEALDEKGAIHMGILKKLMESYHFTTMTPNQKLIAKNLYDPEGGYLVACQGRDFALVYIPTGKNLEIDLAQINYNDIQIKWFDPKSGKIQADKIIKNTKRLLSLDPPGEKARGNDWVLILEEALIQ